ncbi:hypothetical protein CIPAW_13G177200 [Carya illinoinensis]|uniref:Uncharacterized protein n=1 Tax=Carya illinoinensis TaxID=32201 RepID=A0A8T1NRN9_CARIL|nr:hypothetical protein CIPAW_13G177200 [Carya illinoinensis]
MEGDEHRVLVACVISGTLFTVLGSASFSILWAVNWRPWRIYRGYSSNGIRGGILQPKGKTKL